MGVTVEHVVQAYPARPPVVALDGVDLDVPAGELLVVLGPSGSGKTSLLRVIAGFERPDAGRVVLGGRVVVDGAAFVPPNRRRVGIVPQEGALFPHLDVGGNIAFGLRDLTRAERRARVGELLDLVHLNGFEHRRPAQLSGGQQQRVALARALAPRPDVVLLDEPFSALDAALRGSVRSEVADLLRTAAATAILVTHDRAEAMAMADRIAVLARGRVAQTGTPSELYRSPVDGETARLLGEANVLRGVADGKTVTCALGRLPLIAPADGTVDVLVRPELIEHDHADDGVDAVVDSVRFNGIEADVVLALADGTRIVARWITVAAPVPGDRLSLTVNGEVWALPDSGGDLGADPGHD